ncbi:non-ribosomal peptide synthetase [Ktedonobacteria bacterium brp13]|nr:non-ribosomal peptide synthetase [Ktedonobacteria bacterium brp13]
MDVMVQNPQHLGSTFVELLRWRASHHPDKNVYTFLLDGETREVSFSYAELDYQARTVAAYLQEHVEPGARVLLLYPPGLEYIAAIFGCWYAGVVAVPVYPPRLNQNLTRIEAIIQDADAHAALTTSAILSGLQRKFTEDSLLQQLHWLVLEQKSEGLAERWHEYFPARDALALLQYTSGSTGSPKGVMVTHDNLIQNAVVTQKGMSFDSNIHCVGWLPAYHDMGLMGIILEPLFMGGSSVLMAPASFLQQPLRWLQAISRFKANTSGGPNFAFDLCVRKATPEVIATLDLSSWDVAFTGSEPIHAETLERFYQTFAPCGLRRETFYPCYGMAEATLLISGGSKQEPPIVRNFVQASLEQNYPRLVSEHDEEESHQLVSCGRPQPEQRILIVDPVSHVECAPHQVGEIWVVSPNITQGYWRRPQETQEAFQAYLKDSNEGPFLRTGDLGFLFDGELFVTGRLKDMIIIRGQNYYPQDIESAAELSHRALRQNCSAAFSLSVEGDERVILVMEIERTFLHHDPQELFSAIRQAVLEACNVHVYAMVLLKPASMLKTSSGKIQRRACRDALLAQTLAIQFADIPQPLLMHLGQPTNVVTKGTVQSSQAESQFERSNERVNRGENKERTKVEPQVVSPRSKHADMQFSLLYFSSDATESTDNIYELLLESAKFADQHDFTAVWVPERHFHPFGGLYPNPSVLASALAMATQKIRLRAGSVVLPMHHPVRVAEEWSVVDNLSSGRVDLAFALGWSPNDFVLAPDKYAQRKELLFSGIETFQTLWRGGSVVLPNGLGKETAIKIYPLPRQSELTPWITCTSSIERFVDAGAMGANVLTGLLFQSPEELAEKIQAYRRARAEHGYDPETGHVTLMLHTFIGDDLDEVREKVRGPFTDYLKSSVDLWRSREQRLANLTSQEQEQVLSYAFERYFQTHALFGTPKTASAMVEKLSAMGVDEIACLIDFGLDPETVMDGLHFLNSVRKRSQRGNPERRKPALASTGTMARKEMSTQGTEDAIHAKVAASTVLSVHTEPEKTWSEDEQEQSLLQQLYNASLSQQLALLEQYLQQQIAQIVKRNVQEIALVRNIHGIGLDSLMVMSLVNNCQRDLLITLDAGQFYEHTSFTSLAAYIVEEFQRAHPQREGGEPVSDELSLMLQPYPRQEGKTVFPASFAQQRLWFLHQLQPHAIAYNIPLVLAITGTLVVAALEGSLQQIIQRHESLRTTFMMQEEQPVQVVHESIAFKLSRITLMHLSAEERESAVHRLAEQEGQTPFDLEQGPLIRAVLLTLSAQEHVILITSHHIVMDGWSRGILLQELQALYTAYSVDQAAPLAELPIQYAEFTLWQRQWLESPINMETKLVGTEQASREWKEEHKQTRLDKQLAYWKMQLAAPLPIIEFPIDHPRPSVKTFHGAHLSIQLPTSLMEDLKALSQREEVTLFMTLLASFQILLARHSQQKDILVGTPIAGRNRADIEHIIGMFVNTLVLRTDLSGNPSFQELLQRVRKVCLDAYAHQEAPFEQVVNVVQPIRDLSHDPLFQVMFVLEEASWWLEAELPGANLHQRPTESGVSTFDLTWSITSQGLGEIEYNTDLFDATTIERLLSHWHMLLHSIVANPLQVIAELPLIPAEEEQKLLRGCRVTTTRQPEQVLQQLVAAQINEHGEAITLHQAFEMQVQRTPDTLAVMCENEALTYHQLNVRANQLAHRLQYLGVGPEMLVGLCLDRSLDLLIGLLGILKAGGAYVPLDPSSPSARLEFLVNDAHITVVVTSSAQRSKVGLLTEGMTLLCLDEDALLLAQQSTEDLHVPTLMEQVAYIIYTSGSTGIPKGVMVTHKNVIRLFAMTQDWYHFQAGDIWTLFHSYAFDFSVWEIWGALLYGGCLVVVPHWVSRSSDIFYQLLRVQGVTILNQTPSAFRQLIHMEETNTVEDNLALRLVIFGGEALEFESLQQWVTYHGDRQPQLVNMYGITETTVHVTYRPLSQADLTARMGSLIGEAIPDLQLYILDDFQRLVPIGVPGELYVGGMGVTRGYLHRPALTAERFIPHPWSQEPGARLYRTGDLVRYRADGDIEYLGRVDQQVKLRGYRIELGEIEATLRTHPAIQEAVVLVREDIVGDKRLVAYVIARTSTEALVESELRRYLQEKLPVYMVPMYFVPLASLPLTSNGKVDQRSLPVPERSEVEAGEQTVAARTPVEEIILTIYRDILGVEQIDIHESFFDLGGHSLLATQVISRIRKLMHVEVPLRSLFEMPSVTGLAQHVEQHLRHDLVRALPSIVPVSREQDFSLSFAQQRLWFQEQLTSGHSAYAVPLPIKLQGPLHVAILEKCVQEIVQRHESLRTTFVMHSDEPIQVINPTSHIALPIIDLAMVDEDKKLSEALQVMNADILQRFDLSHGPLIRMCLLRLRDDEHLFYIIVHHIVFDAWSIVIFLRELSLLYTAFVQEQPSPLTQPSLHYADFAAWQHQWLTGEVLDTLLAYWTEQLRGATSLELPFDRPRTEIASDRGALYTFKFSPHLSQALAELSRQEGVTLFMTLLTAFDIVLYRYTGQQDLVVGTDIANRTSLETEEMIGFFVNLLVLRVKLSVQETFRETVKRVCTTVLNAYVHQHLPFEKLVDALQLARDHSHVPLVNVLFVLQNTPALALELPGLTASQVDIEIDTAKFDVAMFLTEDEQGLIGNVNYRSDLFDSGTIERLVHHFEVVLQDIVAHPDIPVEALEMLTEQEKEQQSRSDVIYAETQRRTLKAAKRRIVTSSI